MAFSGWLLGLVGGGFRWLVVVFVLPGRFKNFLRPQKTSSIQAYQDIFEQEWVGDLYCL